ncbi:MAG TPA: potassium channel family protein [Gaiellaceae bacterium]
MRDTERKPKTERLPFIDRQVRRIANARSVTVGLAIVFLALALIGAIVIRVVDEHDFPTLGLAVWWSLQTVTTVGYGDIVPTTNVGRIVGGVELVVGISFIAFLTAGVTSTVIERGQAARRASERARSDQDVQTIVQAIANLDKRLEQIESRLAS